MNSFGASDPIPEIHSGAAIRLGRPPAAPLMKGVGSVYRQYPVPSSCSPGYRPAPSALPRYPATQMARRSRSINSSSGRLEVLKAKSVS